MKPEVAIKVLVNAEYSDEWQGNEDVTTAQHMAVDALEKQIPKKVVNNGTYFDGDPKIVCPRCGDDFNCNEYQMDFCWECGQALDWEETE